MDNSKKLTPERILMNVDHSLMDDRHQSEGIIQAMKQFAAQEVTIARLGNDRLISQRDAALDERDNARIWVRSLQKERAEKDALLKEAISLLQGAYQKVNANNRMDRGKIAHEIGQWLIKNVTGKEAGEDE